METYERININGCKKFTGHYIEKINNDIIILRKRNLEALGKIENKKIVKITNFKRAYIHKFDDNFYKEITRLGEVLIDNNLNVVSKKYKVIEKYQNGLAKVVSFTGFNKYRYLNIITTESIIDINGKELFSSIVTKKERENFHKDIYSLYLQKVINQKFIYLSPHFTIINENKILVHNSSRAMLVDRLGKKIKDIEKDWDISIKSDGNLVTVKKDGKYGIINLNGKLIIDFNFDFIELLEDGYYIYKQKGKFGISNINNNFFVKPKYDNIEEFNDGYAIVKHKSKYGIINDEGKEILNPIYDYVCLRYSSNFKHFDNSFKDGIIIAVKKNKNYIIDLKQQILNTFYTKKYYFPTYSCTNNLILVNRRYNNEYCLFDIKGNVLIPWFKANSVHILDDDNIVVDNRIVSIKEVKLLYCIKEKKRRYIYENQFDSDSLRDDYMIKMKYKKQKR